MKKSMKSLLASLLAVFALGVTAIPAASADSNPFFVAEPAGQLQLATEKGEGKCGGKTSEGKSEAKSMCAEKIRKGFCGEGKCGEGKCGESLKETCAKMMEGKCGEGKCGGAKK